MPQSPCVKLTGSPDSMQSMSSEENINTSFSSGSILSMFVFKYCLNKVNLNIFHVHVFVDYYIELK